MKVNFFETQYIKEPTRKDVLFGICDDGHLAYTRIDGTEESWVAVVHNKTEAECQFVPVDHNIVIRNAKGEEQSMCDGMLYRIDNTYLIFIELKEIRQGWTRKPLEQLTSTIEAFLNNHNPTKFRHRFAYAVNRKHPYFAVSRKEEMQTFHNKYGFRLLYQRDISI